jgi:hypothetical protein
MYRSSFTEHGLRIAVAAVVCLAVAPTALANSSTSAASDPVGMAMAAADAALAAAPPLDAAVVAAELAAALPPAVQPTPTEPAPAAPETVPAAAAEPIPAMEPHPSPPPPPAQPDVPSPLEAATELAPISAELTPTPAPVAAAEPAGDSQYQSEPGQYQPAQVSPVPQSTPVTAAPAAEPAGDDWNWDWTWSCGGSKQPTQPPAIPGDGLPKNWNWNWAWNCGSQDAATQNKGQESGAQYQPANTRYQPLNVNVSIRIGSPGDNGPVTQTNVVFAVGAGPASATVQAVVPTPAVVAASSASPEAGAPAAPTAAAAAEKADAKSPNRKNKFASANGERRAAFPAQPVTAEAPSWTARPVVSTRLQRAHPEVHRSRPQLRRPTRRPLSPRRAPAIPVGSGGASPLGGSDGGGFHVALLLVPFALALVDSARRSVRDIRPPMGRAHRLRQERPG